MGKILTSNCFNFLVGISCKFLSPVHLNTSLTFTRFLRFMHIAYNKLPIVISNQFSIVTSLIVSTTNKACVIEE